MLSADMMQEQSRRNWEEESKRRYELEQLAEEDRDRRVEVSLQAHTQEHTRHSQGRLCQRVCQHCLSHGRTIKAVLSMFDTQG